MSNDREEEREQRGRGAGAPGQGPRGGMGLRNVDGSPAITGGRESARARMQWAGRHGGSVWMFSSRDLCVHSEIISQAISCV